MLERKTAAGKNCILIVAQLQLKTTTTNNRQEIQPNRFNEPLLTISLFRATDSCCITYVLHIFPPRQCICLPRYTFWFCKTVRATPKLEQSTQNSCLLFIVKRSKIFFIGKLNKERKDGIS